MSLDAALNTITKKLNKQKLNIVCSSIEMCDLYAHRSSLYQNTVYVTSQGEIYAVNHYMINGICITDKNINMLTNIDVLISDNPLFTSKLIR